MSRPLETGKPWLIWSAVALAAAAGLSCAALLAVNMLPRGSAAVWEWPLRKENVPPLPWTLPAVCCLLFVALITLDTVRNGKHPSRPACAALVGALTLGSGSLMMALMRDDQDYPIRAPAAVLGDMSMGYYAVATRSPGLSTLEFARAFCRDVPERTTIMHVPERVATHPPGPVLLFRAAREYVTGRPGLADNLRRRLENWSGDKDLYATLSLCRRVATFGPRAEDVALSFWPALALTMLTPLVVPLAFLLLLAVEGRRAGLVAAVCAVAIPSLVCFNPSVDGLSAVLALATLVLWLWALGRGAGLAGILCGAVWAAGLFWTFGLAALAPVIIVTGLWCSKADRDVWRLRPAVLGVALGLGSTWLAGYLLLGYNPVTSMIASLATQSSIMEQNHRPYGLSVVWNLYEFALFAGPALTVAGVAGAVHALAGKPRNAPASSLAVGLIVTLAALLASGGTRGEVGRIWGFLMPLLAVPAALPILRLRGWGLISAGLLLVVGQLAFAVVANSRLLLVGP